MNPNELVMMQPAGAPVAFHQHHHMLSPDAMMQPPPLSNPNPGQGMYLAPMPGMPPGNAVYLVQYPVHNVFPPQASPLPGGVQYYQPAPPQAAPQQLYAMAPVQQVQHVQMMPHMSKESKRQRFTVPPPAPGDTDPGPRQLIVNYIATDMTNAELRALFEPFGDVEVARVVEEPHAGHNRGFGFVYFRRSTDAAAAIAGVTGRVMRGKRIRVSYAIPQRPISQMLQQAPVQLTPPGQQLPPAPQLP